MPYRRRRMVAPLQSDKHEVTWSNLGQDAATATITVNLATGTISADKNNSVEVGVGHKLTTLYLEFHFSAAQTSNANVIHWMVQWRPTNTTIIAPNVYYQPGRNRILKRGMEMLPTNVSTVFKRIVVVRIPKKAQRFGEDDRLSFSYQASSTQTINACGIAIYKEYS